MHGKDVYIYNQESELVASVNLNDNSAIRSPSFSYLNTIKKNQELNISSGIMNFNSLKKGPFTKTCFPFTLKLSKNTNENSWMLKQAK